MPPSSFARCTDRFRSAPHGLSEARILTKILQLVYDDQGHRIGRGTRMFHQLQALEPVPLSEDRADDIRNAFLPFLSPRRSE